MQGVQCKVSSNVTNLVVEVHASNFFVLATVHRLLKTLLCDSPIQVILITSEDFPSLGNVPDLYMQNMWC